MIRAGKCFLAIALLSAVLAFAGLTGSSQLTAQWGVDMNPNKSKNVQSFVFDSFEDSNSWRADFSLFAVKKYNLDHKQYELDVSKCSWTNVVGKPWGVSQETATNRCLAVRASFDRKGYNWIDVYPVKKDADGKLVSRHLPMKGKVEYIDVWVWGGNFNYRLEVHLIDYLGHKHILDAGWLNYTGWKSIRLQIPAHVPQQEKYIPAQKILSFEKFVLLSHPGERPDNFYVYFDRMQIQTDIFLDRFDGDDLVDSGYESGWIPKLEKMD
ncbi:MAG: flagellar filament outer layer protein FlaA [Spirochaetota bacterium]|jgi:hypothetical protein|nr:flagellar filament outer layer protein FlaA [Spirochaetota bacterium]